MKSKQPTMREALQMLQEHYVKPSRVAPRKRTSTRELVKKLNFQFIELR